MRPYFLFETAPDFAKVERRERTKAAPAAKGEHEMIEGADRFEEIAHLRRIGGVERPRVDLAGERVGRGRQPVLVAARDRDFQALAGEPPRSGEPDARGSAEDENMFDWIGHDDCVPDQG